MALPRVLCRVRLLLNNDISVVSKYSTFANSVSITKCVQVRPVRQFRTHISAGVVLNKDEKNKDTVSASSSSSSSSSDSELSDSDSELDEVGEYTRPQASNSNADVTVEYLKGLPQITVPLPSRKERCRFTMKPISNTVGDLIEMIKKEDKGIDRVVCKTMDGTRIGSSNTIESLLDDDFKLIINDVTYNVNTPKAERLTGEELKKLDDVKHLISRLYEALNVQDHQVSKEMELRTQLEQIQQELLPLEQQKNEIELVAQRKSDWLAWAGLGLMSVQFGILARLTWWEYSWDIMEPVTYFVTYGTAMAGYAYFVLTKEEYVLQDVRDRQYLLTIHKKAKKKGFDLNQYNMLKAEAVRINYLLKKLRNPLKLKLPPRVTATGSQATDTGISAGAVAGFAAASGAGLTVNTGVITAATIGSIVKSASATPDMSSSTEIIEEMPSEKTETKETSKDPSKDSPKK